MEKWKEDLLRDARERRDNATASASQMFEKRLLKIREAFRLKVRIIEALRAEPNAMFGDTDIYIRTDNHLLVHDVAKELGIELKRSAQSDGFNFTGEIEGIDITVYGMQEVPHCKIVPKKVLREVTEYEVVCNEEGK